MRQRWNTKGGKKRGTFDISNLPVCSRSEALVRIWKGAVQTHKHQKKQFSMVGLEPMWKSSWRPFSVLSNIGLSLWILFKIPICVLQHTIKLLVFYSLIILDIDHWPPHTNESLIAPLWHCSHMQLFHLTRIIKLWINCVLQSELFNLPIFVCRVSQKNLIYSVTDVYYCEWPLKMLSSETWFWLQEFTSCETSDCRVKRTEYQTSTYTYSSKILNNPYAVETDYCIF